MARPWAIAAALVAFFLGVIGTSLAADASDTTPPVLTGLSFPSTSLDTRSGPAALPVTVQATDDISGLRSGNDWYVQVDFVSPSGQQRVQKVQSLPSNVVDLQFPKYAEGGTWHIDFVMLRDNVDNRRTYDRSQIESLGFPTAVTVLGSTTPTSGSTTTSLSSTTTTTGGPGTTTTQSTTTTTTGPPSTTTTTLPSAPDFPDLSNGHPYYNQIIDLVSRHIVVGFPGGSFQPFDPVKRQQFAKMIVLTMDYPVSEADRCPFGDVDQPADELYPDNYVAVCSSRGITLGTAPGQFSPWDSITRAQLITMVARAAQLPDPPASYDPPFGNFSDTHYPWARRAAYAGLLEDLQGMGFDYDFWQPASRGEVCVVLHNQLQR